MNSCTRRKEIKSVSELVFMQPDLGMDGFVPGGKKSSNADYVVQFLNDPGIEPLSVAL